MLQTLFKNLVAPCTPRFSCKNWRLWSISYLGTTSCEGCHCDCSPWWDYCVDLKNGRAWNASWPTLGGEESCCVRSDWDATRTELSSTRGEGGKGDALGNSTTAVAIFRLTVNRVTLDVTMLNESDNISVWDGDWSFKKEDRWSGSLTNK